MKESEGLFARQTEYVKDDYQNSNKAPFKEFSGDVKADKALINNPEIIISDYYRWRAES